MEVVSIDGGGVMVANFPDWMCNLLLWTAIVTTLMLTVERFVPILDETLAQTEMNWRSQCLRS
jgi:hypothetical protein